MLVQVGFLVGSPSLGHDKSYSSKNSPKHFLLDFVLATSRVELLLGHANKLFGCALFTLLTFNPTIADIVCVFARFLAAKSGCGLFLHRMGEAQLTLQLSVFFALVH